MTELGNRLKEARAAKGLSLDDLQSLTKIQKRYLVGIEEGDYSGMPGNFYVRAFIKQYAEAVQLDPEEIFETYKSEIPSTYNEDLPEQLSRVKTRTTVSGRSTKILDALPKIVIAIFVVGVAALVYYFLQQHAANRSNESTNKPKSESVHYVKSNQLDKTKTASDGKKTTIANGQTSTKSANTSAAKQKISVVQVSGNRTTYKLENSNKFILKVVSNGKTWINIQDSKGSSLYQGMLAKSGTSSKTVDLSNDSKAVLVVGNTVDTDIYVNDQKVDYAVKPAQVVLQNITLQYVPKNK